MPEARAARPSPSSTSSTTWNRRPNSAAKPRHGACSASGSAATAEGADRRRPRTAGRSSAHGAGRGRRRRRRHSRYWPPIIPSVAPESSRATSGRRIRERELERLGEQRVAVRGSPSLRRTGRATSAVRGARVVVERRQVVVDERECVHELDRGRGRQELRRIARPVPRRSRGRAPAGSACRRLRGCSACASVSAPSSSRERELREVALEQLALLVEAIAPASRRARSSSASTCFAISASSPRMSIAASGSSVASSSLAGLLEPLEQLLGPLQRLLGTAHAALSRAIRPRIPFTSLPASSVA